MTVQQLIARLQEFPADTPVRLVLATPNDWIHYWLEDCEIYTDVDAENVAPVVELSGELEDVSVTYLQNKDEDEDEDNEDTGDRWYVLYAEPGQTIFDAIENDRNWWHLEFQDLTSAEAYAGDWRQDGYSYFIVAYEEVKCSQA